MFKSRDVFLKVRNFLPSRSNIVKITNFLKSFNLFYEETVIAVQEMIAARRRVVTFSFLASAEY